jgi:hypothetical protein
MSEEVREGNIQADRERGGKNGGRRDGYRRQKFAAVDGHLLGIDSRIPLEDSLPHSGREIALRGFLDTKSTISCENETKGRCGHLRHSEPDIEALSFDQRSAFGCRANPLAFRNVVHCTLIHLVISPPFPQVLFRSPEAACSSGRFFWICDNMVQILAAEILKDYGWKHTGIQRPGRHIKQMEV